MFRLRPWLLGFALIPALIVGAGVARGEGDATPRVPAKPKVGIFKFEVAKDLSPAISDFVYGNLLELAVKSGKYTVVDWEEIGRVLKYTAEAQANISPEDARKLREQLGIEKMFLGSVVKVGSKFYVTVKVMTLDLTVEAVEKVAATSEDDLETAIKEIGVKLGLIGKERKPNR